MKQWYLENMMDEFHDDDDVPFYYDDEEYYRYCSEKQNEHSESKMSDKDIEEFFKFFEDSKGS